MCGCNGAYTMAVWVFHWIFDGSWISVSHWCGMMSWLDILAMNDFNKARWLWSHGDWLISVLLLMSDVKCKSL